MCKIRIMNGLCPEREMTFRVMTIGRERS